MGRYLSELVGRREDLDLGLNLRGHSRCPAVCVLGGPVRNLIAGGISGWTVDLGLSLLYTLGVQQYGFGTDQ